MTAGIGDGKGSGATVRRDEQKNIFDSCTVKVIYPCGGGGARAPLASAYGLAVRLPPLIPADEGATWKNIVQVYRDDSLSCAVTNDVASSCFRC
ncbi:hypothetical protein EVAR_81166_1 [Eumeta japonica]|uniref:Uncharacterized protein n=1 Tax=Eumeta variegata TaxID=151549 RepID=A0A4C1UK33_EUMVA|nr:hypothetical protein EVAR_81166_1 [Eumeta japonica]